MQIILANPRGFCAGVNMAIESLDRSLEFFGAPLYVYHEIVHNKYVVERFRSRGVVFVESSGRGPLGGSPALQRPRRLAADPRGGPIGRGLRAIDATCPSGDESPPGGRQVRQRGVHDRPDRPRRARRGDRHDGRGARADGPGRDRRRRRGPRPTYRREGRLPDPDDLERRRRQHRHRRPPGPKFPKIANPPKDDICYATQNRQEAVRELATKADVVLVLGSQNSSNSKRLAEIARSLGPHAHLIDGVVDLDDSWFEGAETVLITAGASAPEDVVRDCTDYLRDHFGATIREETVRQESVHFPLPRSLRELLPTAPMPSNADHWSS